jgi:hypothetical protein
MKKLKITTCFAAGLFLALSMLYSADIEAQSPTNDPIKKIHNEECRDAFGNLTGFGNRCKKGTGTCVPNPCGGANT